jgi:hypothetical protein
VITALKANTTTEQRFLDYLQQNASEVLTEKINTGKKTLAGAVDYAKGEARKLAAGEDCVGVDDATVFGWVIHYFEEDEITEKQKASPVKLPGKVAVKQEPVMTAKEEIAALTKRLLVLKPPKRTRSKKIEPTQSMFDALFGVKA